MVPKGLYACNLKQLIQSIMILKAVLINYIFLVCYLNQNMIGTEILKLLVCSQQ